MPLSLWYQTLLEMTLRRYNLVALNICTPATMISFYKNKTTLITLKQSALLTFHPKLPYAKCLFSSNASFHCHCMSAPWQDATSLLIHISYCYFQSQGSPKSKRKSCSALWMPVREIYLPADTPLLPVTSDRFTASSNITAHHLTGLQNHADDWHGGTTCQAMVLWLPFSWLKIHKGGS